MPAWANGPGYHAPTPMRAEPANFIGWDAAFVAQVSNLLYRGFPTRRRARPSGRPADWKSATQQVGNLRYEGSALTTTGRAMKYPGEGPGQTSGHAPNKPGLQPFGSLGPATWAVGPGWYEAHLWCCWNEPQNVWVIERIRFRLREMLTFDDPFATFRNGPERFTSRCRTG